MPTDVPLKVDTDQIFAIHSPAQLFGAAAEDYHPKKISFQSYLEWLAYQLKVLSIKCRPN